MINEETAVTLETPILKSKNRKYWIGIGVGLALAILFAFGSSISGLDILTSKLSEENNIFYWMVLTGICAEMVAGSMGMGYGVICTTVLLILNIPPVSISAIVPASCLDLRGWRVAFCPS